MKTILMLLLALTFCGCKAKAGCTARNGCPYTGDSIQVYDEPGVRCYVYRGTGISCIKI